MALSLMLMMELMSLDGCAIGSKTGSTELDGESDGSVASGSAIVEAKNVKYKIAKTILMI